MNRVPRIVIATAGSGGGKTTRTMGIIGALRKQGIWRGSFTSCNMYQEFCLWVLTKLDATNINSYVKL